MSELKYKERQQWFKDRIGKRLYRTSNGCKCMVCEEVFKNGIIPEDNMHASYLHDCESEASIDGLYLRYFDTEEERDKFINPN